MSLFCKHEFKYKQMKSDDRIHIMPHWSKQKYIFRCRKCGKYKSLFSVDLKYECDSLRRQDVEAGHDWFTLCIPNSLHGIAGNEAYALYQKYLRKGFDLTEIK